MSLKRRFTSINTRLLITGLVPLLLLSAVLGWYMISSQRAELLSALHNSGKVIVNQMVASSEFALYSGNQEALEALGYSVLNVPPVSGIMFHNNRDNKSLVVGNIAIGSVEFTESFLLGEPLLIKDQWHFFSPINLQLNSFDDYEESVETEVQSLGWVVVALDTGVLYHKQQDIIIAAVAVILFALLISVWLSMNIGRSISRTLHGLTEVVELMEAGDLDSLTTEDGPEELSRLAHGINQLATSVRQSKVRMQSEITRATSQLQITLIELEAAMESQDQFLARMSHELRTPLTAVIGFSKLLSTESDADKRDEHLRVIERSSTMLLTMIDDILEFSKAHHSGFTLESINFNIVEWLDDLVVIHRSSATEKGLKLSYEVASDVPADLFGDPVRLAQIVSNLVSNAVKFTDNGFVKIEISCQKVIDSSVTLQIVVADSGKGIAPDKIDSLFEPFAQEDISINRRFGGTGLGLSISKRLVEAMNGNIVVESEVNRGTEISFSCSLLLPDIINDDALPDGQLALSQQVLSGLTILVAEDNPFNQKLLVRLLKGYGATCIIANNGLEAIEMADKLHIDVILMDLHMPVIDGITACESIVQQSGESLAIIGLTADITDAEHHRMLSAGALAVQLKPINEVHLVNGILEAISDQSRLPEDVAGGLLSSVVPAEELKAALYDNLDKLEGQLDADEKSSLRQIIHDLMGLCGLYGMSELRDLVTEFRATYGTLGVKDNLEKVAEIREHIREFFAS